MRRPHAQPAVSCLPSAARRPAALSRLLRRLLLGLALLSCGALAFEITDTMISNVVARYGEDAGQRVAAWRTLLAMPRDTPDLDKLKQVNDFFNRTPFMPDLEHWGQEDYWATPLELLASDGGDCEDYAIAKYFTLRELGMPADRLKVTYVKSLNLNQAHMVLAWYSKPSAEPMILDNLVQDILPGSKRRDLVPVYSFDADGLWLARARGLGERVGDSGRLSQWSSINERMEQEFGTIGGSPPATAQGGGEQATP